MWLSPVERVSGHRSNHVSGVDVLQCNFNRLGSKQTKDIDKDNPLVMAIINMMCIGRHQSGIKRVYSGSTYIYIYVSYLNHLLISSRR